MKHISTFLLFVLLALGSVSSVYAQMILNTGLSPNNGGSPGWGMFMDLIGGSQDVDIVGMSTASTAAANAGFTVQIFTYQGNVLGFGQGGPGSDPTGWTDLGTVAATQGATANGISLVFTTPTITIPAGDTIGVALVFIDVGPRYNGSGAPPYTEVSDANLTLVTGDSRQMPFTPSGTFFTSRALCGEIDYNFSVPVELTSFVATSVGNAVQLEWSTASETNNYGFEVERTIQGNSNWDKVGFVIGNGTTTETQYYTYTDQSVASGRYSYRLRQVDLDGTFRYYDAVDVEVIAAKEFTLNQNYPNPFNPSTRITFTIPNSGHTTLKIYNVLGNEVASLLDKDLAQGNYDINFNAADLTSGIYYYTLRTGNLVETKKMMLLK